MSWSPVYRASPLGDTAWRFGSRVQGAHVLVAEECNGYLSYIPTADEYPLGGYGSAAAILAPESEAVLLEATESLARRCLGWPS